MDKMSPVGIFDSGFGGLTVMSAILDELPQENIVYFGDTARLPYGTKSRETVIRYSVENTGFLVDLGVKVVVVACHTACSHALEKLRQTFSIPIIGVTEASSVDIVTRTSSGKIGLLATKGTVVSGKYQAEITKLLPTAEIIGVASPLLVTLVEEGYIDHPLTRMALKEYLQPLKDRNVDTVVLGCTHFPLLQPLIQEEMGERVTVINPAYPCALALKSLLEEKGLTNDNTSSPSYQFYASDDPEKFKTIGEMFLSRPMGEIKKIDEFFLPI